MQSLDRPDVSELLNRARAIAGFARERVLETEAARRVGDDAIARMREADLFRVMQPKAYGGFEYGFDVFAQIEAELASGCGSPMILNGDFCSLAYSASTSSTMISKEFQPQVVIGR